MSATKSNHMPLSGPPKHVPSNLSEQPSVLPLILKEDSMLEDGEPTLPPHFTGEDGPRVAFHLTKDDFENNLRPIGWLSPTVFYYFYRAFPRHDVGKRFVEFVSPKDSPSEDCMYLMDWVLEQGREGIEWQMHKVAKHIRDEEEKLGDKLKKTWRNEPVAVCADPRSSYFKSKAYRLTPLSKGDPVNTVFNVDRGAMALFGFVMPYADMFMTRGQGKDMEVCLALRSQKVGFPGSYDLGIGGGIPAGSTPFQCVLKEAHEEAGIKLGWLIDRIKSSGVISAVTCHGFCLTYHYEVDLSQNAQDEPIKLESLDGSIDEFKFVPLKEVLQMLLHLPDKMAFSINVIFFLIKHGYLTAENEPNFAEVVARLNRLLDFVATPVWRVEAEKQLVPDAPAKGVGNLVEAKAS